MDSTILTEEMKACSKCNELLPLSAFSLKSMARDGHRSRCKRCTSKNADAYDHRLEVIQFVLDLRLMGMKFCTNCRQILSMDDFHLNGRSSDGRNARCKICISGRTLEWALQNKEIGLAQITAAIVQNKQCISCQRTLPLSSFGVNNRRKDGYQSICLECLSDKTPEDYAEWSQDRRRDLDLFALGMKRCRRCGEEKPIDDFAKLHTSMDGHQYKCRECCYISDCLTRDREKQYEYRKTHPEISRDSARKRRAKQKNPGGVVELVKRLVVAERDNWTCLLCNEAIDPNATYLDPITGRPNPEYLNIDHWIPLSKEGEHSYDNCFSTHAKCNWRKNATLPKTPKPLALLELV